MFDAHLVRPPCSTSRVGAVVDVDESLMLTTSSPTLDGLLVRFRTVPEELFTSFLDVTDQGRFVECAAGSDRMAQTLPVTFRGGSGTTSASRMEEEVDNERCHHCRCPENLKVGGLEEDAV